LVPWVFGRNVRLPLLPRPNTQRKLHGMKSEYHTASCFSNKNNEHERPFFFELGHLLRLTKSAKQRELTFYILFDFCKSFLLVHFSEKTWSMSTSLCSLCWFWVQLYTSALIFDFLGHLFESLVLTWEFCFNVHEISCAKINQIFFTALTWNFMC